MSKPIRLALAGAALAAVSGRMPPLLAFYAGRAHLLGAAFLVLRAVDIPGRRQTGRRRRRRADGRHRSGAVPGIRIRRRRGGVLVRVAIDLAAAVTAARPRRRRGGGARACVGCPRGGALKRVGIASPPGQGSVGSTTARRCRPMSDPSVADCPHTSGRVAQFVGMLPSLPTTRGVRARRRSRDHHRRGRGPRRALRAGYVRRRRDRSRPSCATTGDSYDVKLRVKNTSRATGRSCTSPWTTSFAAPACVRRLAPG
jgi:hypothetical protein